MKRFALLLVTSVVLSATLAGCIIIPVPFGGGGHYYRR